jgi:molybdopterin synthase sulfur carrier subunit
VKVRYFAWVRERVGKTDEEIEPPSSVATVSDLIAWLTERGEGYAYAFENPKVIRVAIDKTHVRAETKIAGAGEMTGG